MTKQQPLYERVAIIGGGPTGLAAAKALALEPVKFSKIDLFERRDRLGGLWYHQGDKSLIAPPVPNISPLAQEHVSASATTQDEYFSAVYEFMETNVDHRIMEYQGVAFPPDSRKYPTRADVLDYVDLYVETIPKGDVSIHLNTNVVSVEKVDGVWKVHIEDTVTNKVTDLEYDAIIIANGHFSVPYIPDVPGLAAWNEQRPNTITHSKYYENPKPYKDKRVLVVGNFASGIDVSIQLGVCAKEVIVSVRDVEATKLAGGPCKYIGVVEDYNCEDKSVRTVDGEVVKDIDNVIFCTGYLYSIPFLKVEGIITDGFRVHNVYKQIFNISDPSLSFVALLRDVLPMPIAESQSALIARVYSGRYQLPSEHERQKSYDEELEAAGPSKAFHSFNYPKDFNYCQMLQKLIDEQDLRTPGLTAPIWNEEIQQVRSLTKPDKIARLQELVRHVFKLRAEGKDFSLL
ncbi:Thiol-specific monooxygenase [Candida viswanathii]|uniref:Thiol-specific monooxygenase n=1 Tax=Candida viswanathii TaxID=5486 RepID=A0A367XS70_9ASCO|nr:Thiol-specific monooxygenase [Candida viswanathii]